MSPALAESGITGPVVIDGMSDAWYHGDPVPGGSLSTTGAKAILRSPAHYRWAQEHRVEKAAFDVGHAVHSMVLGVGMDIVAIPESICASNGAASTAEAKDFIALARLDGKVPLKAAVVAECQAMRDAVLAHPIARQIMERPGKVEQSAFAIDPESGVWLRARPDILPDRGDGQTIIGDLKSAVSADPDDFGRMAATFGYDVQDALYQHVVSLARGDTDTGFRFIVVEKSAPWLVSVNELDGEFAMIGRARMRRAIGTYATCRDADEWPGYEAIVHLVGPPRWLAYSEDLVI